MPGGANRAMVARDGPRDGHGEEGTEMTVTTIDEARIEEFAGELLGHYTSGMVTFMVDLGHRTGLFEAAAEGPAMSEELAARAGMQERYVREWLGALVTGGLFDYDAVSYTYTLPAEHVVLLAKAFPASTFVGYDLADDAIERARAEAGAEGVANASFEVRDAAGLTVDEPFDVVLSLDAIHDQVDPRAVLGRIHAALVPGGTYVMVEPAASSNLEDNVANPLAPWIYGVSTLHCMTVSLAHGGAGLGTAWGEQRARRMLAEVGFGDVTTHDAPGDPLDTVYVITKPDTR